MIDPRAMLVVVTIMDDWGRVLGHSDHVRVVRHGAQFWTFEDQDIPVPVRVSGSVDRIEGMFSGREPFPDVWCEFDYQPCGHIVFDGDTLLMGPGPLCTGSP